MQLANSLLRKVLGTTVLQGETVLIIVKYCISFLTILPLRVTKKPTQINKPRSMIMYPCFTVTLFSFRSIRKHVSNITFYIQVLKVQGPS
jgi:hypothetical protein